jgi:hypothetical protein
VRSANATFAIPLDSHEIFTAVDATTRVRNVYVTSYDPTGTDTGSDVLVTVQAFYRGEESFAETRACLMQRNGTRRHQWVEWGNKDDKQTSFGVGVYTPGSGYNRNRRAVKPRTELLEIDMHIAVPLNSTVEVPEVHKRGSVMDTIMSALKPHHRRPAALIPPLNIRSGEGSVHIANLTGVPLSGIDVAATVGHITVEYLRAEVMRINTVGDITANVAVSHFLDVASPA